MAKNFSLLFVFFCFPFDFLQLLFCILFSWWSLRPTNLCWLLSGWLGSPGREKYPLYEWNQRSDGLEHKQRVSDIPPLTGWEGGRGNVTSKTGVLSSGPLVGRERRGDRESKRNYNSDGQQARKEGSPLTVWLAWLHI